MGCSTSDLGQSRHFGYMPATSGLLSTADMELRRENWRYVPRIDYAQGPAGGDVGALMRELWNL
jgi:hypothetical protein